MANNNDTQTKNPAAPPQKSREKTKNPDVLPKNDNTLPRSEFFRPVFATMALIALALSAYSTFQTWEAKKLVQNQRETVDFTMTRWSAQKEAIDKQLAGLSSKWQGTEQTLQTALEQTLYQKQDWLLQKSRYFLELAQINAEWGSDTNTTIALLQQGDAILQAITQQQIYPIRQAIAKEIADLQAVPPIDFAGILSQLDAAQVSASELPINPQNHIASDTSLSNRATPGLPGWRSRLQDSLSLLEKLVVITHYDADITPMLSPLHQTLLRESIRLNLQEAQWALLQHYPKIYEQSLLAALKSIERAFDKNALETQALVKQLQTLLQTSIILKRPVIGNSLLLLNQVIDTKKNPSPAQASTGDEPL